LNNQLPQMNPGMGDQVRTTKLSTTGTTKYQFCSPRLTPWVPSDRRNKDRSRTFLKDIEGNTRVHAREEKRGYEFREKRRLGRIDKRTKERELGFLSFERRRT
jgi:hypothetical protein